ncbi:MAG: hypothetical protein RLZZ568_844, partial [Cyanobacteriota bacterium]
MYTCLPWCEREVIAVQKNWQWLGSILIVGTTTFSTLMTPVLAQPQLSLVPPGAMDIELNSSSPSDQEITKDRFSEFAPTPAVETLANLTELSYVPSNDPDATQASLFPAITPEGEPTPINTADNWLQAENIPITSTQENSVSLAPSASVLLPAKTDYRFGDIVVFSEKLDSQLSLQDLQAPTLQAQNIDNLQAQTVDPPSSAGDPSLQANRPRFSQPLADLAPSGNPSMGFNARPFSDQINVDELITLAEEDKTAQITLPRYVPRVPLDAPTPPEPDLPEPPTSPLPPNVPKEVGQKILDIIIEGLLDHGASKYPFIINTSDLLTINPTSFRPSQFNTYFNFSLDLDDFDRFNPMTEDAFSDPVWKDFTTSVYPSDQQFYWILNGNRVVIESNGAHLNNRYQGIVFNRTIQQQATSRFRLFGRQSVAALPQPLSTLLGTEQAGKFQILSGIAQFVLPRDLSQDPDLQVNFTLNNFDGQGNDFSRIVRIDDIAKGKTSNVDGGGAFFANLEANNAPQFLQGSSTTNLQSLLHNGVQFRPGAIVPLENLQAIGVTPGEFFSGQGFRFNPNNSSAPGIKTLQLNASDNNDLVKLLS